MFQERYNRVVLPLFYIFDLFIIIGLYLLFNLLAFGELLISFHYIFILLFLWSIPSFYFKSYKPPRVHSYYAALKPTFITFIIFTIMFFFCYFLDLFFPKSPLFVLGFIFSLGFVTHIISISRYAFFHQYRLQGKNFRKVLLIGSTKELKKLRIDALHYGYRIVKIIDNKNKINEKLKNIVLKEKIDLIFLIESRNAISNIVSQICDDFGVRLKLLLKIDISTGKKAGLDTMGGFPVMDIRREPLQYLGNQLIKRFIDLVLSLFSIFLVLTWLPIIVKIAQVISYPGPLLFIQKRIGRDGKVFNLYKFRTMVFTNDYDSAKGGESEKTIKGDIRIPWFGQLLRKTNLDEYPQFLNVLMGSMSSVGPRPHMVGEDKILAEQVTHYRVRRFVKPGITGLAAIKGYRGGTDDMSLMTKRTELDIWYLENWTIWLDIKIIFTTILQMSTFKIPKAY
jgi:putative colanic acid biosysnthesis UDP-glucose lipid carrier transferase